MFVSNRFAAYLGHCVVQGRMVSASGAAVPRELGSKPTVGPTRVTAYM